MKCNLNFDTNTASYTKNQSGSEPLNLENGSFVKSDNFDATDWNCWEIVQNPTVREYTRRRNNGENINSHKVIGPWDRQNSFEDKAKSF